MPMKDSLRSPGPSTAQVLVLVVSSLLLLISLPAVPHLASVNSMAANPTTSLRSTPAVAPAVQRPPPTSTTAPVLQAADAEVGIATIPLDAASPRLRGVTFAIVGLLVGWLGKALVSFKEPTPMDEQVPLTTVAVSAQGTRLPRNILIFGPNGSGKGTQGALIIQRYPELAHIESGAIFRQHVRSGTELGKKAKGFIDRGELVPDDITIPMVLATMKERGASGWLLDGFPRNMVQAEKLWEALQAEGTPLDFVVEILLPRPIAKERIMGRRLCATNPNHPNNVGIPAIAPVDGICRVCGGALSSRADDQDEAAIDKRHDIFYNTDVGTLAAVAFFRQLADQQKVAFLQLDGMGSMGAVKESLLSGLHALQPSHSMPCSAPSA